MAERLTLYFDGGCRRNPSPIETAVVVRGVTHFRGAVATGDNNEAEWLAMLHAVDLAKCAGAQDVLLIGDSAVVIGQATGRAKCRSPQLQPFRNAYAEATAGFARVRCRLVSRSKNLAGIALARRANLA